MYPSWHHLCLIFAHLSKVCCGITTCWSQTRYSKPARHNTFATERSFFNLNSMNLVIAMHMWTVAVIRSSASITWTKEEITKLDRKTWKVLTIHGALQPEANVVRLYIKRKNEGKDLKRVQACVESEWRTFKICISSCDDDLLRYGYLSRGCHWKIEIQEKVRGNK